MKRQFLFVLAGLLPLWGRACDICGCFMGITPYDNQSSISLMHRYRAFNGYQQLGQQHRFFPAGVRPFFPAALNRDDNYRHAHKGDAHDYEVFRVAELRAKYFLAQRVELNAFVPFAMNTSYANGRELTQSGLGDVTLFAGYHLLRAIETAGMQSRLIVGGGTKLPTGDFRRRNAEGRRYPTLTQPGTGTTDGFVYANYIGSYRNVGISLNTSYRRATRNAFQESTAPSSSTFANLFYRLPLKGNWQVYPSAQFFYEKTKGETFEGHLTGEHAMNNALLGPGIDVYYQNVSLNASAQFPVYTATTDHPASAGRLVLALGYSFKQTKYLF
ncbi:hypothetical protein FY528_14905 [Hymenobacter lutimineralis]|uniref:Transporter n=1 Tax=Hymenobacter lutimineralis TaxID=2606448 RepID=A0A5D6UX85_9BACT|nr:hypothetical protein [Hymenobacter lutimineralis]TYZ07645.1 hypothetical protein FY528_14905 [Hymenobacter lutimineralis]